MRMATTSTRHPETSPPNPAPPVPPRISVVVPSFNQGRFLGQALESLFRQEYPALEVVVMDGGSTDETADVIRSYAERLTFWSSEPDGGQAAAINAGMGHCTGELVTWLNSDDFHLGDSLWRVARASVDHPGHGLYIGNGLRHDERSGATAPFCRRHLALSRRALAEGLDYVLQPAVFFLREAWDEAGGLRPELHYCLDWDLILRVAARRPAVLIDEFLAATREYESTKTASGGFERAHEILGVARAHTGRTVTPGGLYYLLETLLAETTDAAWGGIRHRAWAMMRELNDVFAREYGNADGFPERGDPQDSTHVPVARRGALRRPPAPAQRLPSISLVMPSFNQCDYIGEALESALAQDYPRLELIVMDGGSTDGSVGVIERHQERLAYWASERDRGPAHALNKGFARATGDVLGWLNTDDLLADGALAEVGAAFADDPELDMVVGNALYVDEAARPFLADHGTHRTALYYGELQPRERIPAYWEYVHAVPQPTVFFRRRLLERCGALDESYHFIFDFELFARFRACAKVRKLERLQACYRIHSRSKTTDWGRFLVELYRYSRPKWPARRSREFWPWWRSFVAAWLGRRHGGRPRGPRWFAAAAVVGLVAWAGVGNPERLRLRT